MRAPDDPGRLSDLIRAFRADPAMPAAVELASPDLSRELSRPSPGDGVTIPLTGYQLRSRHRATPAGLFAGSALIGWADAAQGSLDGGHRLMIRPGPSWLADLAAALEADPELADLAPGVRIAAAPSVIRIGGAHVQMSRGTGGPGRWAAEKSVRRSRLLDAVLALAGGDREGRRGIRYAELLDLVCVSAPGMERKQLAGFTAGLLGAGFLVTDLLPRPGDTDPLGHLTGRLAGHPVAGPLRRLRRELRRVPPSPAAADIRGLRARLSEVWPPDGDAADTAEVVADAILNTDLALPRVVAREVERAASVAWACVPPLAGHALAGPALAGHPLAGHPADRPLAGLHQAVLWRYGADHPVPLAELLDLAGSLGLHRPARFPPGGAAPPPVPEHAARDRLVAGLALDALAAGRAELCLDRPLRARLAALSGATGCPPPADVFAEIVTASAAALDRGDFLIALSSPGAYGRGANSGGAYGGWAGSAAGRLARCLGPGAAALSGGVAAGPGGGRPRDPDGGRPLDAEDDRPLDAEVVFRPPDASAATLVCETGWTAFRIDLTAHPPRGSDRDIALADLSVIATAQRLVLYCARLGRPVRPVSFSALHPRRADAVAALLLALGHDGIAPWRAWDWGAAAAMSWLPRVRVGRAILAPARWALPAELLLAAARGTGRHWHDELRRWRDAAELPDIVLAGPWDRRLPLDLGDPVHAALLRRECRDRGVTSVTEPPGGVAAWRAAGWPRGSDGPHAAEFVISVHPRPRRRGLDPRERAWLTRAPGPAPDRPAHDCLAHDCLAHDWRAPARRFLPGGSWLCVNLIAPAVLQDDVLGEVTDETLTTAAGRAKVDRWFFVRTEDESGMPGLVLRYRGPPHGLNAALLPGVHTWGRRLADAGLIRDYSLTGYRPEVWRYGGEACMDAAERFFHLDSQRCLHTLTSTPVPPVHAAIVAAPAILDILAALLGSRRVVAELPEPRLSKAERRLFAQLRPTARARLTAADRRTVADRLTAADQWPDWHAALAEYRSRLDGEVHASGRAPIAWSVVHMHCNRLAGLSSSAERVAVALARDLARISCPA